MSHLRTVLVLVLAAVLVAWFLRGADLGAVADQIRRARVDLVLLSVVPLALTYLARTIRWRYLLEPIGPARFATVFRATVIGFAAIALLPARVGDVLRPYLLARREGFSASSTLATVVMERALDLVAVLGLLALYVLALGGRETIPARLLAPVEASATLAAAAAVALFAVMWTLATHPERVERLVLRSGRILPGRVARLLSRLARTFSEGFAVAREARALTLALLWSVPVWVGIAVHAWLITRAFGITMPLAGAFLLQALLVIGVALPTPGGVGGYHAMYRFGTTAFFGAAHDAAIGAAIVAHASSFVPVVFLGLLFMIQDGLSFSGLQQLAGAPRPDEEAVR